MRTTIYRSGGLRPLRAISFSFMLGCCLALPGACHNPNDTAGAVTAADSKPADSIQAPVLLPANPPSNFKHQMADVNGIKIHYVIGGEG